MKNSSAGLFLGSSSMSMPNFVWIRWTRSKLLQKHYSPRALEKIYKEPGKKFQKADFFRNDTWVCLDSKYQNPQKSLWRHFFKFELNLAAILDFNVFEKIVKHSIFGTKASVTPLDICFWGHRIHFWCYFSDLTKITRNGGRKYHFLDSN